MRVFSFLLAFVWLSGCVQDQDVPASTGVTAPDAALIALGSALYHDTSLSSEGNQSCASCHDDTGSFADPDASRPVSKGSVAGRQGQRNAPAIRYAAFIPPLRAGMEDGEVLWVGGLFLDGRADSLEAQAAKPFFNPDEMNLADTAALLAKLRAGPNAAAFRSVFGADALDDGQADHVLQRTVQAIAAFERTPVFQPFSSRFDAYRRGLTSLSPLELEGMSLFVRPDKGNCAACHTLATGPSGEPPMLTDFTYDNLGVPRNAAIALADDQGLAATVGGDPLQRGKYRVPTLRNVALTAPYMHNGIFTDLRTVLEFYNTRDSDPGRWAALGETEVPATVNHDELGSLGLSPHELDALEAFLNTLTDGFIP